VVTIKEPHYGEIGRRALLTAVAVDVPGEPGKITGHRTEKAVTASQVCRAHVQTQEQRSIRKILQRQPAMNRTIIETPAYFEEVSEPAGVRNMLVPPSTGSGLVNRGLVRIAEGEIRDPNGEEVMQLCGGRGGRA
jgi:hypothetical protein